MFVVSYESVIGEEIGSQDLLIATPELHYRATQLHARPEKINMEFTKLRRRRQGKRRSKIEFYILPMNLGLQ